MQPVTNICLNKNIKNMSRQKKRLSSWPALLTVYALPRVSAAALLAV
jgi:hypothetical protein